MNTTEDRPAPLDPRHAPKRSMFVTDDGRNVLFTFILLVLLFALWGFCNGMIDVMDKHFQEELHLTLAQSAWVQFAHYLGYFIMALPAGWLATKLGYKGGIITGLLMVAVAGFWFIPATHIAAFWAFLLGVCIIAAGLTFLETIANPYTTVFGSIEYGATRINLAQSCSDPRFAARGASFSSCEHRILSFWRNPPGSSALRAGSRRCAVQRRRPPRATWRLRVADLVSCLRDKSLTFSPFEAKTMNKMVTSHLMLLSRGGRQS